MMRLLNLTPNTPEWLAHRRGCYNASDAPAMMGVSPHKRRNQLLDEILSGLVAEVGAFQERLRASGHEFEGLARPVIDEIAGEPMPAAVGVLDLPGISRPLSASLDGLSLMGDVVAEHKRMNDAIRAALPVMGRDPAANDSSRLGLDYRVQMEQQLLVSSAERVLFIATLWSRDGALQEVRCCWYVSDPVLRDKIIHGWMQLDADRATHVPRVAAAPAETPAPTAAPVSLLSPSMSIRVVDAEQRPLEGTLAIISNLPALRTGLRSYIEAIPATPTSDADFLLCERATKRLKELEDALVASEEAALASLAPVEEMRRLVKELWTLARDTRLDRDKKVKDRKLQIRREQCERGQRALREHDAALRKSHGVLPGFPMPDFQAAISGLKNFDSLTGAIDDLVASTKATMNAAALVAATNKATLTSDGQDWTFLFPDLASVCGKPIEDFAGLLSVRVSAHREAEARRRAREAAAAAPPPTAAPTPAPTAAPAPVVVRGPSFASGGAAGREVSTMSTAPARPPQPEEAPTLKLGTINERIAPLEISAKGLAEIGFPVLATIQGARLYRESDFPRMVDAIIGRLAALLPSEELAHG